MIAFMQYYQMRSVTQASKSSARARRRPLSFGSIHFALALFMSFTGFAAQAQNSSTVDCIIASHDGRNSFRTDEISACRIDTKTGVATFVLDQESRTRSYDSFEPLTTRHLEIAKYWLDRAGRLWVPTRTNPAGFDPQEFLQAASQATHGFVLVRKKRSGASALNVVYITNGVYRSIDFPGTNLREMPSGFLMTGQ